MQETIPTLPPPVKGRGSSQNPENRFERLAFETDPEWLEAHQELRVKTDYFVDHSKEILAKNDSPDLPFTYSINPYRGCEHGCVYCYARPTHEYFGLSAGLDFETKIMVKLNAPALLERKLRSKGWQPQPVAFSGNTDCYQLIERKLGLTRKCLDVFLRFRNPVAVITKSDLVARDLDILREMARLNLVRVTLSVTTLDNRLARKMEPRASAPQRRLETIERLAEAAVPTCVNVAPVIPGLTDHEMPAIMREAAARGAGSACYIMLRLPYGVKGLFSTWLEQHYADRAGKVTHAVEDTHGGLLYTPCFSTRMRGEGVRAEAIEQLFEVSRNKYGLARERGELTTGRFRRHGGLQRELFVEMGQGGSG